MKFVIVITNAIFLMLLIGCSTVPLNTDNTAYPVKLLAYQRKAHDTAIPANYSEQGNGTVIDNDTGLHWMRCSLGQAWHNGVCAGKAKKYSWQNALNVAKSYRYAGYSDWRVPTIKELNSLVYCSNGKSIQYRSDGDEEHTEGGGGCRSNVRGAYEKPTIRQGVFPNTAVSSAVWSSSPGANGPDYAWSVYFRGGYTSYGHRSYGVPVRLVRSGQ